MFQNTYYKKLKGMMAAITLVVFFNQTTLVYAQLADPVNVSGGGTVRHNPDGSLYIDAGLNSVWSWTGTNVPTYVNQPNSTSWASFVDTSGHPTNIGANMSSNAFLAFINQMGINIAAGVHIMAAGLFASTLNVPQEMLRNGFPKNNVYSLTKDPSAPNALILNKGTIEVSNGGQVTLIAGAVRNEGDIIAQLGKVTIASGETVALTVDNAGLMSVAINEALKTPVAGVASAISNIGRIIADGGIVTLSASTLNGIFQNAINNEGLIQADALENKNGEIYLTANDRVNVAGNISAVGGKVRVDSQGANYSGTIKAADSVFNAHDGDTFIHGTFSGNQSWFDNINIFVDGNLTVTGGNILIDADHDNNGTGNFTQNAGTVIHGNKDVTINGDNVYIENVIFGGNMNSLAKTGEIIAKSIIFDPITSLK